MLSGRSTVVAAIASENVWRVLPVCRWKLGLANDGTTKELWHCSGESVPDNAEVQDWPGVQPLGEISEYQLLLRR
eukprot:2651015-Amphidinium_carterae.1